MIAGVEKLHAESVVLATDTRVASDAEALSTLLHADIMLLPDGGPTVPVARRPIMGTDAVRGERICRMYAMGNPDKLSAAGLR